MSIGEYIVSALRCLSAGKMRTFLTTLGIIVGISSVILINTIGGSIGKTIGSSIGALVQGNIMDILIVDKDAKTDSLSSVMMLDIPDGVKFNQDSVKEYEEMMTDYLEEIAYVFIGAGNLNSEDSKNTPASICVMSESIQKMQIASLEEGRYFTEEDYNSSVPAIIIESRAAEKMFGNASAIGKQITLSESGTQFDGREFTIVGVATSQQGMDMDTGMIIDEDSPTTAYITLSYFRANTLQTERENIGFLEYGINEDADIDEVRKLTEEFFAPYFEDTDYKVFVYLLTDQLDQINGIIGIITKVIAAIAAISLLVGGIGVMNIMLVSVSERTMEIGVRKAMGADNKSIRMQFIIESIVISLIGSVLGIVVGLIEAKGLALILSGLSGNPDMPVAVDLSVPVPAIIVSVIFSFAIGLVFGVYPANKAAQMEVVDALRYE